MEECDKYISTPLNWHHQRVEKVGELFLGNSSTFLTDSSSSCLFLWFSTSWALNRLRCSTQTRRGPISQQFMFASVFSETIRRTRTRINRTSFKIVTGVLATWAPPHLITSEDLTEATQSWMSRGSSWYPSICDLCLLYCEFTLHHHLGPRCILLYWIQFGSKGHELAVATTARTARQVASFGCGTSWFGNDCYIECKTYLWDFVLKWSMIPTPKS